jgi:hypothetical protein
MKTLKILALLVLSLNMISLSYASPKPVDATEELGGEAHPSKPPM